VADSRKFTPQITPKTPFLKKFPGSYFAVFWVLLRSFTVVKYSLSSRLSRKGWKQAKKGSFYNNQPEECSGTK